MRLVVCSWIALIFSIGDILAVSQYTLPVKPAVLPDFHVPRENSRALDENWLYVQTLYDAEPSLPEYFGAVPVGFAKANQGRAFIATLHTVFRSLDAGRNWANLDPQPAPTPSIVFESVRSPNFISDIVWRPVRRPESNLDSLYLTVFSSENDSGVVRLVRGLGNLHSLWPDTLLQADHWLTSIAAPDSNIAVALAGLDARIYRNDSMKTSTHWDILPEHFTGSWVKKLTTEGNFTYAVGSLQWLSLDRGFAWQTLPPADPLGDIDIDFAPNGARGIVCGGQDNPPSGWIRFTTDFGQTWSPRTLQVEIPVRTVLMLNDTLGYAAGGLANDAIGRVWRTTDGGATWEVELEVEAEINELGFARESGGYINVIATGYFADFSCGVWRSHLLFPDTTGAALGFSIDTLDFFAATGQTSSQQVTLKNYGSSNISVIDILDAGPFQTDCCVQDVLLQPGDSMVATITFAPTVGGDFNNSIRVLNDLGEFLELIVHGSTFNDASPRVALPNELALSVYPNPGNAEFRLSYSLFRNSDVTLKLFDVSGREVATIAEGNRSAGEHVVQWNASAQASGVYFAVLSARDVQRVEKIVLMK